MKSLNPNDLGKKFVVEECQKISIITYLRKVKGKIKETLISSEIEAGGVVIELTTSKTAFNGTRYWFKCPLCGKRAGVLFKHPLADRIGCRICLNLDYRKRRYKGMVENLSCFS